MARRLVESWPYSYLLCDEVGLGKTIEAGLAFRSLHLSGLVKRILIAAPASLTLQWQRQLASKLLLSFGRALSGATPRHAYIFPTEEEKQSSGLYEPDLNIVSTGLLARSERRAPLMEARPFDIALVDEAHAARRQNPTRGPGANPTFGYLYTALREGLRKQARCLWLATATPMQIDPVEPCDLLALTNRVGAFQYDPSLTLQYYEVLGRMLHDQTPGEHDWSFLQQAVLAVQKQDPLLWRFLEHSVMDGRIRAAVRQWLEHGRIPRGRDRELIQRFLFSASPLSRVMLRHTRQLLEIYRKNGQLQENLAHRHILAVPRVIFTEQERQAYVRLEEYCTELSRQISEHGDGQARTMMGFLLNFLRLRFASSLFALRETLKRRSEKVEATLRYQLRQDGEVSLDEGEIRERLYESDDDEDLFDGEFLLKNRTEADLRWEQKQLKIMLGDLADLEGTSSQSSKMQHLLRALDKRLDQRRGRIKQTVIFTRFYDTLMDIVKRLRGANPQMLIGTYSGRGGEYFDPGTGRMLSVERDAVKERFLRGGIDVLVCTDAAAEGLNLQTADLLVNFDLGWNPMKVEQRIGRIDRIGQKHTDIYVLNLCYADSAEHMVYGRLLQRLTEANMIVGTQQFSLLPVKPEDFQQLAEGTITPEALEARARERMEEQRRLTQRMEINPEDLYEIYMRLSQKGEQSAIPVDLSAIWDCLVNSEYLSNLGCNSSETGESPVLHIYDVEGVPNGTVLTVSRELYDQGLDDINYDVRFASYGDPVFDAIVEKVTSYDLPPCVQRITVPLPGREDGVMVAYAAMVRTAGGVPKVCLINAWNNLEGIELAENDTLAEAEIEPLRVQLQQLAGEEMTPYLVAERIEKDNLRAALAQELLALLVMYSLLKDKARIAGKGATFWQIIDEIEAIFRERETVSADGLPANIMRELSNDLLFKTQIPRMGDTVFLSVPRVLGQAALDGGRRLADSMKKKSELGVETILSRLKREADDRLEKLRRL